MEEARRPAFAKGVIGPDNVARMLASIFPVLAKIDARVEPRELNGHRGAILRDRNDKVVGTLTLDVLGGRIQTIRPVVNADKLGHVGPVAGAWAVAREVNQARRPKRLTLRALNSAIECIFVGSERQICLAEGSLIDRVVVHVVWRLRSQLSVVWACACWNARTVGSPGSGGCRATSVK
jgi:hypothetical protein